MNFPFNRFNQEFLSSLDREAATEYGSFDEKIKHMGKISRKKFQQLAKMFTFQRKKNASLKPKSSKLLEESEDEQEAKGGSSSNKWRSCDSKSNIFIESNDGFLKCSSTTH